jgi:hypothetical protein
MPDETREDTGTRLTRRHALEDRESVPEAAAGRQLRRGRGRPLLDGQPIPPVRGAAAGRYGWPYLNDSYAKTLDIPAAYLDAEVTVLLPAEDRKEDEDAECSDERADFGTMAQLPQRALGLLRRGDGGLSLGRRVGK